MIDKILCCLYSQRPPLVWGPPGVGKSAMSRYIGRQLNLKTCVIYLSHKADNEVHGQPVVAKATVELAGKERTVVEQAPPRYVIEALKAKTEGLRGALLVFEELTTVQPAIAAPALAIFSENMIAEIDLPWGEVGIMACANPTPQAVGGWDLAPPSSRRFTHLKFQLHPREWCENFPGNWGAPVQLGRWGFQVDPQQVIKDRSMVAAFINSFPEMLFQMPKDKAQQTGCWLEGEAIHVGGMPNPASWEATAKAMSVARTMKLSDSDLQEVIIGTIGQGAALQFDTWREKMDLPSPQEVLDKPALVSSVPANRSDQLYYMTQSCVELVRHKVRLHKERPEQLQLQQDAVEAWRSCWEVIGRVLIGPLNPASAYKDALQAVLAGKRAMAGPKDVGAVGGRHLVAPDAEPRGAPVRTTAEIDLVPLVTRTAGVDWSSGDHGTSAKKRK